MKFKNFLVQVAGDPCTISRKEKVVLAVLDETVAALRDLVNNDAIELYREIGHGVNCGLQHNIVVFMKDESFHDIFLRAYVPANGYPVILDVFDDEYVECLTMKQLKSAIQKFFTSLNTKERIRQYHFLRPRRDA